MVRGVVIKRGGSSGRGAKVSPQKISLVPAKKKTVSSKNHNDMKRDMRHVFHTPHLQGGSLKFGHMDVNTTDSRDGVKATRTINMRGTH